MVGMATSDRDIHGLHMGFQGQRNLDSFHYRYRCPDRPLGYPGRQERILNGQSPA